MAWLTVTPVAAASRVTLGCEAGLSLASIAYDDSRYLPLPEDQYGHTLWIRGGIRARLPLDSRWAIIGGLTYESNGGDAEITKDQVQTSRLEYATLPVALEIAVPTGNVRPFGRVGFEPGILIDADTFLTVDGKRVGDSADTDDYYPSVEWTLSVTGGLRLRDRWDAHMAYRYGLTNLNDSLNREEHHFHNRGFALGVTYWFPGAG